MAGFLLTDRELEEIRGRYEAASPEPWDIDTDDEYDDDGNIIGATPVCIVGGKEGEAKVVIPIAETSDNLRLWPNLIFAAEARADVPALYKTVETLKAALMESLAMQAHYAHALTLQDGQKRRGFLTIDAWVARLVETGVIKEDK